MSKKVDSIEEALVLLTKLRICWRTVNRIQNSLWETGVAFFGEKYERVAYFDENDGVLTIN